MKEIKLFLDNNNQWITNFTLLNQLIELGANDCSILYIHSSLTFGKPNPSLKRAEILHSLFDILKQLNVRTICMPTFTFSYCNNLEYNLDTSCSKMGALNEFFRKQDGVIRSIDPLMSIALMGDDIDLVKGIGNSSIGTNSTFDKLRHRSDVKFLFLGAKIGDCFTYMHYLEWLFKVDYRYDRIFEGTSIIDGVSRKQQYELFVRYNEVHPNNGSYVYEKQMYDDKIAKIVKCGDSTISIVKEREAANVYYSFLKKNKYFFVEIDNNKLIRDTQFLIKEEMIAL